MSPRYEDILDRPMISPSQGENNHSDQLLLFPGKDFITLRDIARGIMVFGEVGSGKTSTASAQFARLIEENASFSGLVVTQKVPSADEEA